MYIFPNMIDMGLKENQSWPSPEHRQVAQNIALGNKNVTTRDQLTEIVQEVLNIPEYNIKLITLEELPISSQYI